MPVSSQFIASNPIAVRGQGFGSFGPVVGDGNATRLDQQTSGFVLETDTRLDESRRAGIAGYRIRSMIVCLRAMDAPTPAPIARAA